MAQESLRFELSFETITLRMIDVRASKMHRQPFRYQAFISDIAGQDIHAHGGAVETLIGETATWLRDHRPGVNVPGGLAIAVEFEQFSAALPAACAAKNIEADELSFLDYWTLASEWVVATDGAWPHRPRSLQL